MHLIKITRAEQQAHLNKSVFKHLKMAYMHKNKIYCGSQFMVKYLQTLESLSFPFLCLDLDTLFSIILL